MGCRAGSGAIFVVPIRKIVVQHPSRVKEKLAVDMFQKE